MFKKKVKNFLKKFKKKKKKKNDVLWIIVKTQFTHTGGWRDDEDISLKKI